MTNKNIAAFAADSFKGKNIIVTGGGSGIGLCTAKQLAQLGATVFIFGRNVNKLKSAVETIKQNGGHADYVNLDIREEAQVVKAVSTVVSRCKDIHGLVNNAGGQFLAPLSHISQRGFEAVVKTNLTGTFLVSREVYNQSMSKCGGSIVNMLVSGVTGGFPSAGHSGAARAGVFNLTQTAAVEWAASNVRVNAVAPGSIWNSGMDNYDPKVLNYIKALVKTNPLPRFGTDKEVSNAITFLLSDLASFITGISLPINGGEPLNTRLWPFPESIIGFNVPEEYLNKP